jgi:8-oxo-dGTP diphosphatase
LTAETFLHVAVGVIQRDDRVLLSRRALQVHQGGKWEFPGGKLESGEDITTALRRELQEELGIIPLRYRPLIKVPHCYPEHTVLLDVWQISEFSGEPAGREGQPIEWVPIDRLADFAFPAANRPIVQAVQLPPYIAITPEGSQHDSELGTRIMHLTSAGYLVHLRLPGLDAGSYTRVVASLFREVPGAMSRVVLTSCAEEVVEYGAAGLHLDRHKLMSATASSIGQVNCSASCHNLEEMRQAESIGLRYVFLSPVLPTQTHPGAETLGWALFEELVAQVALPVYALGGMQTGLLEDSWQRGAQGVAGIRGFWSA